VNDLASWWMTWLHHRDDTEWYQEDDSAWQGQNSGQEQSLLLTHVPKTIAQSTERWPATSFVWLSRIKAWRVDFKYKPATLAWKKQKTSRPPPRNNQGSTTRLNTSCRGPVTRNHLDIHNILFNWLQPKSIKTPALLVSTHPRQYSSSRVKVA
jgi:hypothetical protein